MLPTGQSGKPDILWSSFIFRFMLLKFSNQVACLEKQKHTYRHYDSYYITTFVCLTPNETFHQLPDCLLETYPFTRDKFDRELTTACQAV